MDSPSALASSSSLVCFVGLLSALASRRPLVDVVVVGRPRLAPKVSHSCECLAGVISKLISRIKLENNINTFAARLVAPKRLVGLTRTSRPAEQVADESRLGGSGGAPPAGSQRSRTATCSGSLSATG